MLWICRQPWVTWWHPGARAGLGVLGTVAPTGGGIRPRSGSAVRTRGVGVGCTFTSVFEESVLCGVAAVKENPEIFRNGERGLCSVLTTLILITSSSALSALEKPLLRA